MREREREEQGWRAQEAAARTAQRQSRTEKTNKQTKKAPRRACICIIIKPTTETFYCLASPQPTHLSKILASPFHCLLCIALCFLRYKSNVENPAFGSKLNGLLPCFDFFFVYVLMFRLLLTAYIYILLYKYLFSGNSSLRASTRGGNIPFGPQWSYIQRLLACMFNF